MKKQLIILVALLLLSLQGFSQCIYYTIDPEFGDTICIPLQLRCKALLSGPLVSSGLMNDDLRSNGLLPNVSPYDNTINVSPGVFSNAGNDAIVDWIKITIKSNTLTKSISGLIQRDGDIVDENGNSPLSIIAPIDSYYVKVSHRNHLGIQTLNKVKIDTALTNIIDFTNVSLALYSNGTNSPTRIISGKRALFAGNGYSTTPEFITYNGYMTSDRIGLYYATLINGGSITGYSNYDFNMNGIVNYMGTNCDRLILLMNCNNSNTIIIKEQTNF